MKFLAGVIKDIEKMEGVSMVDAPPRWSLHTGNYVLNRITSGSFRYGGIAAQGRVGILTGPSGAGKSFVLANHIREAQKADAHILVLDSENALDSSFVTAIGVDVNSNYTYVSVTTISQVVNIVSSFLKQYKDEFPDQEKAPKVFIAIDSLDMLMTDTELEHYAKGVQKGDQGQKNKQLKAFLKTVVQDVKALNVAFVATAQCYKNQDVTNGEGVYVVADAIKFSASSITMLTKLKLKDGADVTGIRMKCEGYKARFTQPFQTVVIEVPYSQGMSPTSGLVEVLVTMGVVEKAGSRYRDSGFDGTWFAKDIDQHLDRLLAAADKLAKSFVKVSTTDEAVDVE